MDFTREPIVETVVTAREGCKLAIRNSKGVSQDEFFVDAVEVVSFGNAFFYRSLERPKSFLVPVTDYELLEVRETRMVLKTPAVKSAKGDKQQKSEKKSDSGSDKPEKKRERRRSRRRSKDKDEDSAEATVSSDDQPAEAPKGESKGELEVKEPKKEKKEGKKEEQVATDPALPPPPPPKPAAPPSLTVAPPTELISETLRRYKEDELYQGAFFTKDEVAKEERLAETPPPEAEVPAAVAATPEESAQSDESKE